VTFRVAQSRAGSLAEAARECVVAGYLLTLALQRLVYPLFSISTTLATDSVIAALFTATSLARLYVLRRVFEALAQDRWFGTDDART
jgi:hypothetical protein